MDYNQNLDTLYDLLEEDKVINNKKGKIGIVVNCTHGQMYIQKCCRVTIFYDYKIVFTIQQCEMTENTDHLTEITLELAVNEYKKKKEEIWNLINSKPQLKNLSTTE